MKTLIYIGGFYHLAFFVFHLSFWKLFDWRNDLQSLSEINRAVIQILNLRLMWIFLVFAYISFFHADELLSTSIGKTILVGIIFFWLVRATEQIIFFGLKRKISVALFAAFLLGASFYLSPFVF